MSFLKSYLIIPLVILISVYLIFYFVNIKKFNTWVYEIWGKQLNTRVKISHIFYAIFIVLFTLPLLDPRGPAKKADANIPDQKTIIIIDSSASMLAEDVKPNRFQKSLMMARHFVRKSVGHQIAIVSFSDYQKRIVPFTDDLDLLDARISSLEELDITKGGSSINLSIKESLQYFLTEKGSINGNLLVFTDGEDHFKNDIEVPENVNIALVGVGTLKGGKIPLRSSSGGFKRFKKFNGTEVITKLKESYFKGFVNKIKKSKYWIVQSYSIPTEEIIDFFRKNFLVEMEKGSITVRPVWAPYFASAGILFFTIGVFSSFGKSFLILALVVGFSHNEISADEFIHDKLMEKYKENDLNVEERQYLGFSFLSLDDANKAEIILKGRKKSLTNDALINLGVSYIKNGKIKEGLDLYKELSRKDDLSIEQRNEVLQNTLLALSNEQKKKSNKSKENDKNDKNKNNKNDENQNNKNDENKSDNEKNNDNDKDNKKNKKQDGDKKDSDKTKNKGDKKNDDKKKNGKNDNEGEQNKDGQDKSPEQKLADKEKEIEKKRKMKKVPALIKQILNEDRNLQKKYYKTILKGGSNGKKDW